jgi:hypothetical protein
VRSTSIQVQGDEFAMTISRLIVRWFDQWFGTTRNIAHVIRTSLYLPGEIWSNPGEIGPQDRDPLFDTIGFVDQCRKNQ